MLLTIMRSRRDPARLPAVSDGSSVPDEHAVSLPAFSQNDDGNNLLRREEDCGVTSSAPSPEEADETFSSSLASSLLSTSSTVLVGDRYGEGGVSSDPKNPDVSRVSPAIPCCGETTVANTSSPCPGSTSPVVHNEEDVLASAAVQFEISRETRMAAALMIANKDHSHKRTKDITLLSSVNEAAASTDAHTPQSQVTRVSRSSASVSSPSQQSVATSSFSQKTQTEERCPSSPSTAGGEDEDVEILILRAKDLACRLAPQYLGLANDGSSSAQHTSQEYLGAAFVTMGSTNRMVRVWNRSDSRKACAVKFFGKRENKEFGRCLRGYEEEEKAKGRRSHILLTYLYVDIDACVNSSCALLGFLWTPNIAGVRTTLSSVRPVRCFLITVSRSTKSKIRREVNGIPQGRFPYVFVEADTCELVPSRPRRGVDDRKDLRRYRGGKGSLLYISGYAWGWLTQHR